MRKKRTTQKATETIMNAASRAADAVKTAPISETAEKAAAVVKETAEKVVEKVAEEAPEIAAAVRTRISDVTIEIFETCVDLAAVEKAVKKDAADKNLKGEIKIYINAERRAAYYTVNGEGSEVNKIDLTTL